MENKAVDFYSKVEIVPDWAKKEIQAGRLKGMTDINPQWRILCLVEQFGFCGIGWKYSIKKLWSEKCETETVSFAEIELFIKVDKEWSDAIPGIGGSKMGASEKNGIYVSDECYKMAVTDAISVACKMIGIGASIYSGSKYENVKKFIEIQNAKSELDIAIDQLKESKTIAELKATYECYPHFKNVKAFYDTKEQLKSKLQ